MMKIFIDNKEADTDQQSDVSVSLSVASIAELNTGKTGYSKSITLPMTTRNREIMGDTEQVNSPATFNSAEHTARIESGGAVVIDGTAQLTKAHCAPDGGGYYVLNIVGAGKSWLTKAAKTPLRELDMGFEEAITDKTIRDSWTWSKPVRFLPVKRASRSVDNPQSHLFLPSKILSFEDYHPFLHVRTMVEKIFENAGYSIASEFMGGPLFDALHISGKYLNRSLTAAQRNMAFLAGRFEDTAATADSYGRVHTDVYRGANTVGNIVDTADPDEARGGQTIDGVYDKSGCIQKNDERISFNPTQEVTVGFEFSLFYTTEYYMRSREELGGFDTIYLGDGVERKFLIPNRNRDMKDEMLGNMSYRVVVFDYQAGDSFKLEYRVTDNGVTTTRSVGASTRSFLATTYKGTISSVKLYKKISSTKYAEHAGDWAVYEGYVGETGEMEIEAKIRCEPQKITRSSPKYFNNIWFGGAQPGMAFTLRKQTTLRPVLSGYPCLGSTVGFEQVAAHDMSCAELIGALKHMFNLNFYTDTLSKTVYIEPAPMFYRDKVVDWSSKLDVGKPIAVTEVGAEIPRRITLRYADGDEAVARWDRENGERIGAWSADVANTQSAVEERVYVSPVFTPSINSTGDYPDALAASLVQAGDEESEELNFPPKIVAYAGMVGLPNGQLWGWPGNASEYPLAAFHFNGTANAYTGAVPNPDSTFAGSKAAMMGNGFSLCFEDRDGVAGLHKLYDRNISLYNESKRVETYIALDPEEVEALTYPNRLQEDFRALYRLGIEGEHALFRLEEVVDYNPHGGSTKCIFIKETSF